MSTYSLGGISGARRSGMRGGYPRSRVSLTGGTRLAEVAGIEPTGRGSPVPLVLKTRGATRPRSPPGAGLPVSLPSGQRPSTRRSVVKKLLVLLILVAIGIAVARKVREV